MKTIFIVGTIEVINLGKSKRGHKERSREQELRYENSKLRREISSLRKQLARIDLDRYSHVKEMVQEHLINEREDIHADQLLENMKNEWSCHKCRSGFLEIILYTKMGNPHYYRQCNECPNRTKSQQYIPGTPGPIKQSTVPNVDKNKKSYKS